MKTLTKTLLTLSIGLTLTSNSFATKMYFVDQGADKIFKADLNGANVEEIISGLVYPSEIKIDETNSKIYWSDPGTDKIQRANLDGSTIEDIITTGLSNPAGLALDVTNSKIYWTDYTTKKIQRANFDGTGIEDLITGLSNPRGIDLDITNSKMYWSDTASEDIRRANFDGTGSETLVTGLSNARELFLDLDNSKMYWIDNAASKIQRANLDGSSIEDVVTGLGNAKGLTIDKINSKLIWGLGTDDKIQRADLDGSNIEDIVSTGINSIKGITVSITDAPLSVELISFSARQIENSIQLDWSTASETENEGFNVYRKTSDSDFIKIASYKSHNELLGQGNSTFEANYTFVDDSELRSGKTYTYYISDVETNGLETKHEENAQTVKFVLGAEEVNTKKEYKLTQNFPNPFNPTTTISYQIAKDTKVSLKIYNIKGEFVKELTNGFQQEGSHSVVWNGTDANGKSVSSGTYFYKLQAGTFTQINKMILLK